MKTIKLCYLHPQTSSAPFFQKITSTIHNLNWIKKIYVIFILCRDRRHRERRDTRHNAYIHMLNRQSIRNEPAFMLLYKFSNVFYVPEIETDKFLNLILNRAKCLQPHKLNIVQFCARIYCKILPNFKLNQFFFYFLVCMCWILNLLYVVIIWNH